MAVYTSLDSTYLVYVQGEDLTFEISFVDAQGGGAAGDDASYVVVDETGAELVSETPIPSGDISGNPPVASVTVPAAINVIPAGARRAFREIRTSFVDAQGNPHAVRQNYIVEALGFLEQGVNSFAPFGALIMQALDLPRLDAFHGADERDRMIALAAAHSNIGRLRMPLVEFIGRESYSSMDLIPSDFATLDAALLRSLRRAQVIEANAVLGGNPIEDRRNMGLMSNSVGEVTQFFRVAKPLQLAVCRETAQVIGRYVAWKPVINRA